MGKHNFGSEVKCPYYQGEGPVEIRCEGMADGSNVIMRFRDKERLRKWRTAVCEKDWERCPMAKGLNEKWGYEV